jgi:phenylacetic acid degradation operon negative regulatory protein
MSDEIMKIVRRAPIRSLIYSCLSACGEQRGGELPGPWFSEAFDGIGHTPSAVRLALFRMVRNGELEARKEGRVNFYRLASFGRAGIEAGLQMLFGDPETEWDGRWTIVHFHFPTGDRVRRDHIRNILTLEGFGCLGPGAYAHPHNRAPGVLKAMGAEASQEVDGVTIYRGRCVGGATDEALAHRLWDVAALNERYDTFLRNTAPLEKRVARCTAKDAFFLRIGVVLAFLDVAWADPELPPSLLPDGWLGFKARRTARRLYESLWPLTLAHGDEILAGMGLAHLIPDGAADTNIQCEEKGETHE